MKREEYKNILLKKNFLFEKTQKGYPGRGEEDVYTHPDFKYKFYVTRVRKENESLYGFYTGDKNGEHFDSLFPRNEADNFRNDRALHMWVDDAFVELMNRLGA